MNINYEYYKIFYYAAKNRSFSRTAKVLLTNQPNITRVIKILEGELGCTLFNRMKNGVTLTPEGEILYEHISKAVELITERPAKRNCHHKCDGDRTSRRYAATSQ